MSCAATPSQRGYIDVLYTTLNTPFERRQKPRSTVEAAALIRDLKQQVEELKDTAIAGGYNARRTY